jgi:hypothetical protein
VRGITPSKCLSTRRANIPKQLPGRIGNAYQVRASVLSRKRTVPVFQTTADSSLGMTALAEPKGYTPKEDKLATELKNKGKTWNSIAAQ